MGANDGIVSISSMVIGVLLAGMLPADVVVAGMAALVAGAMSMAAGEYVSVSSQSDMEHADLARERRALDSDPDYERHELAKIYRERGVSPSLSVQVADQLMEHDALAAHAMDELGISIHYAARPVLAATVSAVAFAVGGGLPLLALAVAPTDQLEISVGASSLLLLALLGILAARAGGASILKSTRRVVFWGVLAMSVTASIGYVFNVAT